MRCPNCGAENRPQARFCGGCGQELLEPSVQPATRSVAPPSRRTKRWTGVQVALLGTLSVLLLAMCGLLVWLIVRPPWPPIATPDSTVEPTPNTPPDEPTPTPSSGPNYLLLARGDVRDWRDWDVYVSDVNGQNQKLLKQGVEFPRGRFSPNGKWLVFLAEEDAQKTLYVADADGANLRSLCSDPSATLSDVWVHFSVDGSVAFFHFAGSEYLYNRRADRLTDATLGGHSFLDVSIDGKWALRDAGSGSAWSYELLNTATGSRKLLASYTRGYKAALAPDGSRLAVEEPGKLRIYEIAEDRWWEVPLSESIDDFRFLPDGKHIIEQEDEALYIFNIDTGARTVIMPEGIGGFFLTGTGQLSDSPIEWYAMTTVSKPTGNVVIHAGLMIDDEYHLGAYLAKADGSSLTRLTDQGTAIPIGQTHILLIDSREEDPYQPGNVFSILELNSNTEQTLPGRHFFVQLSSDGHRILGQVTTAPDYNGEWHELPGGEDFGRRELWLFDTRTSQLQHLGSLESDWVEGTFSSNGSEIVYSEVIYGEQEDIPNVRLYVADSDGSNPRLILEDAVPLTLLPEY